MRTSWFPWGQLFTVRSAKPPRKLVRIYYFLIFIICVTLYHYLHTLHFLTEKHPDESPRTNWTKTTEYAVVAPSKGAMIEIQHIDSTFMMAQTVRLQTLHSWKAYRNYAWGKDEVEPLTRMGTEWMGAALTMIDALDSLWIMDLMEEFNQSRRWIANNLKFDMDNDHISLFESTIRIVGGLISAYELSGDELFLEKSKELGAVLLVAFGPHSLLPRPDVNFAKRTAGYPAWSTQLSLSEVSSIQLEFNQLSVLSKDWQYAKKSGKVLAYLHSLPKHNGLLPLSISPSGAPQWKSRITLGARGDSYYEYLLKTVPIPQHTMFPTSK